MEEGYRQFSLELGGQASLAGLRTTVAGLGMLPGARASCKLTESLTLSTTLKPKFDAIIGLANRANITVYPVDATGLRVHSKEMEVSHNVNVAGSQGVGDERRGDGPWTRTSSGRINCCRRGRRRRWGDSRKRPAGSCWRTPTISQRASRMQGGAHDLLPVGVSITNTALDGTFRKVSVKVKRPKVTIRRGLDMSRFRQVHHERSICASGVALGCSDVRVVRLRRQIGPLAPSTPTPVPPVTGSGFAQRRRRAVGKLVGTAIQAGFLNDTRYPRRPRPRVQLHHRRIPDEVGRHREEPRRA